MTDARLEACLFDVLREATANPDLRADRTTLLRDIPEWDSMNEVEAILLIETHCGIGLGFDEFHAAASVGELLALVRRARFTDTPEGKAGLCPDPQRARGPLIT